jgi:GT2 family glycosyltransferase
MVEKSSGLVDVIVVTKGANNAIESCLRSLACQAQPPGKIIIIDNSADNMVSRKLAGDQRFEFLPQTSNLAYGQALNKGIEASAARFILCLNDDVVLDEHYIENAIKGFDADNKAGMVSGRILRHGSDRIDSTGLFLSWFRSASERDHGARDRGQRNKAEFIFGVSGAVAFYRREMLEHVKVGNDYFEADSGFFYEDLDLAWRANNFGWRGYYVPSAVAWHVRGLTAREGNGAGKRLARRFLSDELYISLINNRHLTIIKNERLLNFLLFLPFILLYDLASLCFTALFRPRLMTKLFPEPNVLSSAFHKRKLIRSRQKPFHTA